MKSTFTITSFLIFVLVFSSVAGQQLIEKTVTVDNMQREYKLYVPEAYDGSEKWPLVLNFHGFDLGPDDQIFASKMNAVADTGHFFVAYPRGLMVDLSSVEGLNPVLPKQGTGWNIVGGLSQNDDLSFINQLIDQVDAEYGVQENRVYATGLSFGGLMSFYLACQLNDRIAAVASVANNLPKDERFSCSPPPFPVLYMQGTADPIVPFQEMFSGIGAEPTVQFWLDNNNCAANSTDTVFEDIDMTDGSTVTRFAYQDCAGNSEVWFYRIDGGGHNWPGGGPVPEFFGNVNRDINASSEIWNFFQRHSLETTTATNKLLPSDIDLRAYPNPVYDQFTIEFKLPETVRVQLTIFNNLGQPLYTLAEESLAEGQHQFHWETRRLPAGIYFYQLQVDARQISQPIMLMARE